MTDAIEELADSLEEHASNRADFRDANDAQRYRVARQLVIARSQVNASNAPEETQNTGTYSSQLVNKKNRYFYACGVAGIDVQEAETIWWSVVYGGLAPYRRVLNV